MNQDILSSRYGVKKSNPKRFRLFAILGLIAMVGTTAYFAIGNLQPFSYKDVGYRVLSETRIEVDVEITKAKDATVICSVEALNNSFAPVGWKEFEFGPAEFDTLRHTLILNTTEAAVTGLVDECRLR
ncbi:MAG: DUF4307 domain-containing protein [Actinobacteria bacterium]|nr:DUF4307 domain-containing protein [Actinomycetota bacterium]